VIPVPPAICDVTAFLKVSLPNVVSAVVGAVLSEPIPIYLISQSITLFLKASANKFFSSRCN